MLALSLCVKEGCFMDFEVIRKIDKLGRIVIPKDFRRALRVDIDSEVSIRLTDGIVTIRAIEAKNGNCDITGE